MLSGAGDGSASAEPSLGIDVLAWVYWIFAICYALASVAVMLTPLVMRVVLFVRTQIRKCSGSAASGGGMLENQSELDALVPKVKR